jgi:hypothetical protein
MNVQHAADGTTVMARHTNNRGLKAPQKGIFVAHVILYQIDPSTLTSTDLAREARKHAQLASLEAYKVIIDGQAQPAECLYFGDRDIAGIAWGADADWLEGVESAEDACRQVFIDLA